MEKTYLQITSGRGPVECCRVVALVLERILKQAQTRKLKVEIVEKEAGPANRTLLSAVIALEGAGCDTLVEEWEGTVLWIARSPYRIHHRRKIGLSVCRPSCCPKAVRQPKMKSVMKLCGLPDPADSMSIRRNLL